MHVLPTAADLRTADEKCEPIKNFVPLTDRSPEWQHGAKFCNDCQEPFDFVFVRKHHCHVCGVTYCSRCAPKRHILSKARGCGKCTSIKILEMKDKMLEQHVSSPRVAAPRKRGHEGEDAAFESPPLSANATVRPADVETTTTNGEPNVAVSDSSAAAAEKEEDGNVSSDAEGPSPRASS